MAEFAGGLVQTRVDGHGLGPSMGWVRLGWVGSHFPAHVMGWVGLNEKYRGIVAEYCRPKTHTFHCP